MTTTTKGPIEGYVQVAPNATRKGDTVTLNFPSRARLHVALDATKQLGYLQQELFNPRSHFKTEAADGH